MSRSSFRPLVLSLLVAPLFLSACGEGYEPVLTDQYFPYGNQRTAGSGVAYVLAKMMPEKELKLEPVEETKHIVEEVKPVGPPPPPAPPPAPVVEETPMEKVFEKAQTK